MSHALPTSTTQQLGRFTLHIKHVPASLSHRKLHNPMPILDAIRLIRNNQQTGINQQAVDLVAILHKTLAELSVNQLPQPRFLILAQSRKLALSLLHSSTLLTHLQAHFKPITRAAHQPANHHQPHHATVLLCYPSQEEPLCTPHMVQTNQHQTNTPRIMAHIFTPQEVDRIAQHAPKTHTPTA